MSNYTTENLVPILNPQNGVPAIRVGDQVFPLTIQGGGNQMDFYKCASVSSTSTVVGYTVAGAGSTDCNGTYTDTGLTKNGKPVYSMYNQNTGVTWYIFYFLEGEAWVICHGDPDNILLITDGYYDNSFNTDIPTGTWSVDTGDGPGPTVTAVMGTNTWTGYKAVFDAVSGTYSFESTATSGLTYGNGINPQVGGVYNSDATIAATLYQGDSLNIPGLVFYAPLSSLATYAITGQEISGSADAYATVQGIPCARFSSLAAYLSASDSALPHGNVPVTVSCWLNYSVIPSNFSGILTYGNSQSFGQSIAFPDWSSVLFSGANGVNALTDVTPSTGTWYHFLSIYDGNGTITNYVNGVVSGQPWSSTLNIGTGNIQIAPTEVSRDIYMASARIYNRALTAAEVAALAAEFTPTSAT